MNVQEEIICIDDFKVEEKRSSTMSYPRTYATRKQKYDMSLVNPRAIEQLGEVINSLPGMSKDRVLDVASGGGELTRDLLNYIFNKIDMIDYSEAAGRMAKELKKDIKKTIGFERVSMQDFDP